MKTRLLACAAVLSLAAGAVHAQTTPVERREIGNQILENVPVAPASVREGLNRYQSVRSASFQDWTEDGAMLITTRFGNTAQLHGVAFPGGDRSQLTFHDEPIGGAH